MGGNGHNIFCRFTSQLHFLRSLNLRGRFHQSRRHGGALVGLGPSNRTPGPPNWNKEHYKPVDFCRFSECQAPLHKRKAPYWRLSGDGSGFHLSMKLTMAIKGNFVFLAMNNRTTFVNANPETDMMYYIQTWIIPFSCFHIMAQFSQSGTFSLSDCDSELSLSHRTAVWLRHVKINSSLSPKFSPRFEMSSNYRFYLCWAKTRRQRINCRSTCNITCD